MKVTKIGGASLIISGMLLSAVLIGTKTEVTVGNAAYTKNYENIYPPDCFISFENKKYLIAEIYRYKNKVLREYSFAASEGFATRKFSFPFEMNYSNEQRKRVILRYSRNSSFVEFDSHQYKISEKRKDTIISKLNSNALILFIEK